MRYGRFLGLVMLGMGVVMGAIALWSLGSMGATLKVMLAGPALAMIGAAMLVFPGENISFAESQQAGFNPKTFMRTAPLHHRIAWTVAGIIGFVATLPMLF